MNKEEYKKAHRALSNLYLKIKSDRENIFTQVNAFIIIIRT
jgi:hypothetical protein